MKVKLSEKQIEEIVNFVEEHGRKRRKVQGEQFSDIDFAMGAAAVFYALGIEEHLPVSWIFRPMSGKPLFVKERQTK